MDLFEFDNVKAEKANAMIRYRRLRKIAKLFRLFELCLALILLSWLSTRLPDVFQISGKFFKDLSVVLVSPRFVFLVGNAIVLTLFAKSRQFSGQSKAGSYLYEEFMKNTEVRGQKIRTDPATVKEEEVVFQDKEIVSEESCARQQPEKKVYRSHSEHMKPVIEKPARELRRSATVEKCGKVENPVKRPGKGFAEEMSDEEFNRKIEEFIAKQVRFHKEESMAIVIQNNNQR